MKRILCLLSILILASTYAKAQNAQEIIQNFLDVIEKNDVISYTAHQSIVGKDSKNQSNSIETHISIDKNDTLLGAFYNFQTDNMHIIYNGFEFLEYLPEYYGVGVIKASDKINTPTIFQNQTLKYGDLNTTVVNKVESLHFYQNSLIDIYKTLKKKQQNINPSHIKDTLINGEKNWFIKLSKSKYYINASSNLLSLSSQIDYEGKEILINFTNYRFNSEDKAKIFSRKAFPEEYAFVPNPNLLNDYPPINKVQAPEWELTNLNGEIKKLEDYKGKNLLFVFSLKYCPPCVQAMPYLDSLSKANIDINVCMLYPINKIDDIISYQIQKPYSFEMFVGAKELSDKYQVQGFPTFFLIDKNGFIQFSNVGFSADSKHKFNAEIEKLPK